MSPKVLTPDEVARYRQQLALGVPLIMAAGPLLDSHEALRALVASTRRAALDEAKRLVQHLRQPQGYAVEPSADHKAGYAEALMDMDDELDQALERLRDTPRPKETP